MTVGEFYKKIVSPFLIAGGIVAALMFLVGVVSVPADITRAQSASSNAGRLTGWAWSDTVGWVSFGGPSYSYGVYVAPDGTTLGGYAWADTIGWISFNSADTSTCGATAAQLGGTKPYVYLSGWARAIVGTSATGWDGCINLRSTTAPTYGPAMIPGGYSQVGQGGKLDGYAWGSDVVGWLTFNPNANGGVYVYLTACNNGLDDDGQQGVDTADPDCTDRTVDTEGAYGPGPAGTVDIKANGKDSSVSVSRNASASITWTSTNEGGCVLSTPSGSQSVAVSGSLNFTITARSTFSISCQDLDLGGQPTGPTRTDSVIVGLTPVFQEI